MLNIYAKNSSIITHSNRPPYLPSSPLYTHRKPPANMRFALSPAALGILLLAHIGTTSCLGPANSPDPALRFFMHCITPDDYPTPACSATYDQSTDEATVHLNCTPGTSPEDFTNLARNRTTRVSDTEFKITYDCAMRNPSPANATDTALLLNFTRFHYHIPALPLRSTETGFALDIETPYQPPDDLAADLGLQKLFALHYSNWTQTLEFDGSTGLAMHLHGFPCGENCECPEAWAETNLFACKINKRLCDHRFARVCLPAFAWPCMLNQTVQDGNCTACPIGKFRRAGSTCVNVSHEPVAQNILEYPGVWNVTETKEKKAWYANVTLTSPRQSMLDDSGVRKVPVERQGLRDRTRVTVWYGMPMETAVVPPRDDLQDFGHWDRVTGVGVVLWWSLLLLVWLCGLVVEWWRGRKLEEDAPERSNMNKPLLSNSGHVVYAVLPRSEHGLF